MVCPKSVYSSPHKSEVFFAFANTSLIALSLNVVSKLIMGLTKRDNITLSTLRAFAEKPLIEWISDLVDELVDELIIPMPDHNLVMLHWIATISRPLSMKSLLSLLSHRNHKENMDNFAISTPLYLQIAWRRQGLGHLQPQCWSISDPAFVIGPTYWGRVMHIIGNGLLPVRC